MTLYRLDLIDDQRSPTAHQCYTESKEQLCDPGPLSVRTLSAKDLAALGLDDLTLIEGTQYGRTWPEHIAKVWHEKGDRGPNDQPYYLDEIPDERVGQSLRVYTDTPTLKDHIAVIEADGRKIQTITIREAF